MQDFLSPDKLKLLAHRTHYAGVQDKQLRGHVMQALIGG